jgi:DNA-binding response OmpR family regulator
MIRDIVQGFASGADDYLFKPFDTSELVMRVNTLITNTRTLARRKTQMTIVLEATANNRNSFEDNMKNISSRTYMKLTSILLFCRS